VSVKENGRTVDFTNWLDFSNNSILINHISRPIKN